MENKYCALKTTFLTKSVNFIQPRQMPSVVHLNNPAYDILLDFHQTTPLSIAQNECMFHARQMMEASDLHIILVTDDENNLMGLLSLEDVLSKKTVKMIEKARVKRKSVLVKTVMTPLNKVPAISYQLLQYAKVGNIIKTLQVYKSNYAIVVASDSESAKEVVCGLFLASKISKQLGENIRFTQDAAHTLLELQEMLEKP